MLNLKILIVKRLSLSGITDRSQRQQSPND